MTDRDFEHLAFGLDAGVDWVAVSFVRSAADIERVRAFIDERGKRVPIVAKIEKHEALEDIDAIVLAADGIMVARGDLGDRGPARRRADDSERHDRARQPRLEAGRSRRPRCSSR